MYTTLLVFGIALSLYQGYRGYKFQEHFINPQMEETLKDKKGQRFLLLYLADGFTFFICSLSGFWSLYICYDRFYKISDPSKIEVGTATIIIFLLAFGILGITGKMPYIIDRFDPSKINK